MIKIIGGKHKGRYIDTPHNMNTRPTSSKLRESIFNILLHSKYLNNKIENIQVLDTFAGSGALGLECLSRGFKHCTFLDNSSEAIQIINKNIIKLNEKNNATVIKTDVTKPIQIKNNFGLCFFDPPYVMKDISLIINKWNNLKIINEDAIYIYEKHKNMHFKPIKSIEIIKTKQLGISEIIILKKLSSSTK